MVLILRIDYRGIDCKNLSLYSMNCLSRTPHDFLTFLLIQHINKTNKCINHQNPTSPAILQPTEKPATWLDINKINWLISICAAKHNKVGVLMFRKFFVALTIFYIKPTCFKKHLPQDQLSFHFLRFILRDERDVQFFIFWGTSTQIFGAKKDSFCTIPHWFLISNI